MPTCPAGHDSASDDFCDVCGMRISVAAGTSATAGGLGGSSPPAGTAGGLGGSSPPASTAAPAPPAQPADSAQPCPQCGTARSGQFCEACGFDFVSGTPPAPPVPAPPAPPSSVSTPPAPAPGAPVTPAVTGPGGAAAAGTGDSPAPGSPDGAAWTAVVAADRGYYDNVIAAGGPDAATVQFPGYCPERRFLLTGLEMRIGRRSASRGLEPEIDLTGPPADPGVSRLHAVLIAQPGGGWAVLDPGSENGTMVNDSELATGVKVLLHDGDRIHVGAWTLITIRAALS